VSAQGLPKHIHPSNSLVLVVCCETECFVRAQSDDAKWDRRHAATGAVNQGESVPICQRGPASALTAKSVVCNWSLLKRALETLATS